MTPSYQLSGLGLTVGLTLMGGLWLVWPYLLWTAWRLVRQPRKAGARVAMAVWLAGVSLFAYAHFIEPRWITQRHTVLKLGFSARIALISDYHLGLFKGPDFLQRVVDELNTLEVDAVLIAGDHLSWPHRPLVDLLEPLKRLKHPAFSVPGNHDDKAGETPQARDLRLALLAVGVTPVEHTHAALPRFTVVGLGDRWAAKDGREPLLAAPRDKPIVALFHNPDTAMTLHPEDAVLALAGHTHGGQLRIPGVFRRLIPTQHPFDRGLHTFTPVPTYVSSGVGESGVPFRLFNPPVIDVLVIE